MRISQKEMKPDYAEPSDIEFEFISQMQMASVHLNSRQRLCFASVGLAQLKYSDDYSQVLYRDLKDLATVASDNEYLRYILRSNWRLLDASYPYHLFSSVPRQIIIRIYDISINLANFVYFKYKFALAIQQGYKALLISDWFNFSPSNEGDEVVFEVDQAYSNSPVHLVCLIEKPFGFDNYFCDLFEKSSKTHKLASEQLFGFTDQSDYSIDECDFIYECYLYKHYFSQLQQVVYIAYAPINLYASKQSFLAEKLFFYIRRPRAKNQSLSDMLYLMFTEHRSDSIPIQIRADWQLSCIIAYTRDTATVVDKIFNYESSTTLGLNNIQKMYVPDKENIKSNGKYYFIYARLQYRCLSNSYSLLQRNTLIARLTRCELLAPTRMRSFNFFVEAKVLYNGETARLIEQGSTSRLYTTTDVLSIDKTSHFHSEFKIHVPCERTLRLTLVLRLFYVFSLQKFRLYRGSHRSESYGSYVQELGSAKLELADSCHRIHSSLQADNYVVLRNEANDDVARLVLQLDYNVPTMKYRFVGLDDISTSYLLENYLKLYYYVVVGKYNDYHRHTAAIMEKLRSKKKLFGLLQIHYILFIFVLFHNLGWLLERDTSVKNHIDAYYAALFLLIQLMKKYDGTRIVATYMEYQIRQAFCKLKEDYKGDKIFGSLMNNLYDSQAGDRFFVPSEYQLTQQDLTLPELDGYHFVYLLQNLKFSVVAISAFFEHLHLLMKSTYNLEDSNRRDLVVFSSQLVLQLRTDEMNETLRENILKFYGYLFYNADWKKHLSPKFPQMVELIALSITTFISLKDNIYTYGSIFGIAQGPQADVEYPTSFVFKISRVVFKYLMIQAANEIPSKSFDFLCKKQIVEQIINDGFSFYNRKLLNQECFYLQEKAKDYIMDFLQFVEQFVVYFSQFDIIDSEIYKQCDIIYYVLSRLIVAYMESPAFYDLINKTGNLTLLLGCYLYFLKNARATSEPLIIRKVHIRFLISVTIAVFSEGFSENLDVSSQQQLIMQLYGNYKGKYEAIKPVKYQLSERIINYASVHDKAYTGQHSAVKLGILNSFLNDILHLVKYYFQQRIHSDKLLEMTVMEYLIQLIQFKYIDIRNLSFILNFIYVYLDKTILRFSAALSGKIFGRARWIEQNFKPSEFYINKYLFLDITKQGWLLLVKYYQLDINQIFQFLHLLIFYEYIAFCTKGEFDLTFTMAYSVFYSSNEKFYNYNDKKRIDNQLKNLINPLIQIQAYYPKRINNEEAEKDFFGALSGFIMKMQDILGEMLKYTLDAIQKVNNELYTDLPKLFESYIASIYLYNQVYEIGIEQYTRIFEKLRQEKLWAEYAFWYLNAALFVSQFVSLPVTNELIELSKMQGSDLDVAAEYLARQELPLCFSVFKLIKQIIPGLIGNKIQKTCAVSEEKYSRMVSYLLSAEKIFFMLDMFSYVLQIDLFRRYLNIARGFFETASLSSTFTDSDLKSLFYKDKATYFLIIMHSQHISDAINDKPYIYHYNNGEKIQQVMEWFKAYHEQSYKLMLGKKQIDEQGFVFVGGGTQFSDVMHKETRSQASDTQILSGSIVPSYQHQEFRIPTIHTSPQLRKAQENLETLMPRRQLSQTSDGVHSRADDSYMTRKFKCKNNLYIEIMPAHPFVFYTQKEELLERSHTSRFIYSEVVSVLNLDKFLLTNKSDMMGQFSYIQKFAGFGAYINHPCQLSNHVFVTKNTFRPVGGVDGQDNGVVLTMNILAKPLPSERLRQEVLKKVSIYYPPMLRIAQETYDKATALENYLGVTELTTYLASDIFSGIQHGLYAPVYRADVPLYEMFKPPETPKPGQNGVCDDDFESAQFVPIDLGSEYQNVVQLNYSKQQQYMVYQMAVRYFVCMAEKAYSKLKGACGQLLTAADDFSRHVDDLKGKIDGARKATENWPSLFSRLAYFL